MKSNYTRELKYHGKFLWLSLFFLVTIGLFSFSVNSNSNDNRIISYTVDTKSQNIQFYWKNNKGEIIGSIQNLKTYVESKNMTLNFAMNGGMYMKDLQPLGLYIEDGKKIKNINKEKGSGNFYLEPNGVFYITNDHVPYISKTFDFDSANVKYATQSGPMLVINGQIHPAFKKGSTNLNVRNGVGVLPGNKVVFAISKTEINFYDFAKYFQQLGCENALYLDGYVSRMYLPEKEWVQTDGNFGVIIGVTSKK